MQNEIHTNIEFYENKLTSKSKLEVENKIIKNHGTTTNNIGINNQLTKQEKEKFVQEFIKKIAQKLNKEKIFIIDRFEGNLAVCENRETRGNDKHRNNKITKKCSRK